MAQPLMPKATAVWLIDNTTLTFPQIAEFCGLHPLEVQAIADGEVAAGMQGHDPVAAGQLTMDEIERCQKDAKARLKIAKPNIPVPAPRTKGARYTPVAKRHERPDAIAWLLRHQPELNDGQIARLVGTTKPTINAVRDRSHWNTANIKPRSPIELGLCSYAELEAAVQKARRAIARAEKRKAAEAKTQGVAAAGSSPEEASAEDNSGTESFGEVSAAEESPAGIGIDTPVNAEENSADAPQSTESQEETPNSDPFSRPD